MTNTAQGNLFQKLAGMNEQAWLQVGSLSETLHDTDRALSAYETALRHNPYSIPGLIQAGHLLRQKEQYLQDPFLWYGIGMLYERYGTDDHAEEAFLAVIKMDPKFEKIPEIYFRLAHIYKHRQKYDTAMECFKFLLGRPPKPLSEYDIIFQIGHLHECQKDYATAKDIFEKIANEHPNHTKSIQQLGWLHFNATPYHNIDMAIAYFKKGVDIDPTDALSWYLLGRCFIAQQKYSKAYEAYQQAVYRDGKNPMFWCSIGVLYFQINQYRDALDAYSRAIHINPYLNEVWWNLGTLYESCNNQIADAIDAYQRGFELDPANSHVKQRLSILRTAQATNQAPITSPPPPHDINPNPALTAAYTAHAFLGNRLLSNYRAPHPKSFSPSGLQIPPSNSTMNNGSIPSINGNGGLMSSSSNLADYSRLKPHHPLQSQQPQPFSRPSQRMSSQGTIPVLQMQNQSGNQIGFNQQSIMQSSVSQSKSPRNLKPDYERRNVNASPLSLQLAVEQELENEKRNSGKA